MLLLNPPSQPPYLRGLLKAPEECLLINYIPQTKTARQGRGSYFPSIVIHLEARKSECQPRYLSPAANSLDSRIAECQPRYLSPAVNSLDSRIAECQQPSCQSPGFQDC